MLPVAECAYSSINAGLCQELGADTDIQEARDYAQVSLRYWAFSGTSHS
jgi:hypothetical protein